MSKSGAAAASISVDEVAKQLQAVPKQTGVLAADADGKVLVATGELKDNAEKHAAAFRQILQDTKGALDTSNRSGEAFKKVTVTFKSFRYTITVASNIIFVVKTPGE